MCGFKNRGWSRTFCKKVRVKKMLLVKCNEVLSNWTKESLLFCFCKLLFPLDLRICFCLKRARPWLKFRIKFSRYSKRSFQKTLLGFKTFEFILLLESLIVFLCLRYQVFPPNSWVGCLGGRIFSVLEEFSYSFFSFPFSIFWNSIYLIYTPQFG